MHEVAGDGDQKIGDPRGSICVMPASRLPVSSAFRPSSSWLRSSCSTSSGHENRFLGTGRWERLAPDSSLLHLELFVAPQSALTKSDYWDPQFMPHSGIGNQIAFIWDGLRGFLTGTVTASDSNLPAFLSTARFVDTDRCIHGLALHGDRHDRPVGAWAYDSCRDCRIVGPDGSRVVHSLLAFRIRPDELLPRTAAHPHCRNRCVAGGHDPTSSNPSCPPRESTPSPPGSWPSQLGSRH